jgi:hypothetical protein
MAVADDVRFAVGDGADLVISGSQIRILLRATIISMIYYKNQSTSKIILKRIVIENGNFDVCGEAGNERLIRPTCASDAWAICRTKSETPRNTPGVRVETKCSLLISA